VAGNPTKERAGGGVPGEWSPKPAPKTISEITILFSSLKFSFFLLIMTSFLKNLTTISHLS
jgi:hypothetical protein